MVGGGAFLQQSLVESLRERTVSCSVSQRKLAFCDIRSKTQLFLRLLELSLLRRDVLLLAHSPLHDKLLHKLVYPLTDPRLEPRRLAWLLLCQVVIVRVSAFHNGGTRCTLVSVGAIAADHIGLHEFFLPHVHLRHLLVCNLGAQRIHCWPKCTLLGERTLILGLERLQFCSLLSDVPLQVVVVSAGLVQWGALLRRAEAFLSLFDARTEAKLLRLFELERHFVAFAYVFLAIQEEIHEGEVHFDELLVREAERTRLHHEGSEGLKQLVHGRRAVGIAAHALV